MSVVLLAEVRAKKFSWRSDGWTVNEVADLTRLYRAKCELDGATDFAQGTTDCGDPQFYVLSDGSNGSCNLSISRLMSDGRPWYVIEDGKGHIEKEGYCLRTLVTKITKRTLARGRTLAAILTFFAQQFLGDGFDPFDIASAAECLMAIT